MKRNTFLNLIAIQTNDKERLNDFVNKWIDKTVSNDYPINFAKYFGVDDKSIPTMEEVAAYDLLSDIEMLKSSYLDLNDDILVSTINTIFQSFSILSNNITERSDIVNPVEDNVQYIEHAVITITERWTSTNSVSNPTERAKDVELLIKLFDDFLKRVRRMSPEVTLFNFEPFNTVDEVEDFNKPDETLLTLFATLLNKVELAEEGLECLGNFLDENTYVLALPSKNDSLIDFTHDVSSKYDFQVSLYFGDGNVSGHLVSTAGVTEFDYKEPELRTVKMLLDAVGLGEEELTYFKYHAEILDEEEEIDPVEYGAFGVN